MTKEGEITLLARIDVHSFLIEQLWANLIAQTPDPRATIETLRNQTKTLPDAAAPAGIDPNLAMVYADEMRRIGVQFWDRIETRLAQGVQGP